jgi:hypothetical protein
LFVNREKTCDECGTVVADIVSLNDAETQELATELWEIVSSGWRVPRLRELYTTLTGEPVPALPDDE